MILQSIKDIFFFIQHDCLVFGYLNFIAVDFVHFYMLKQDIKYNGVLGSYLKWLGVPALAFHNIVVYYSQQW